MNELSPNSKRTFEASKETVENNPGWSLTKQVTGLAVIMAYLFVVWYVIIKLLISIF